jgi:hypothetical protein
MKTIIGQISFWGAVIGAILLALNLTWSGWAYVPFLISNIATVHLLRQSNSPKVIEMQSIFFIIVNIVGIFRWLM